MMIRIETAGRLCTLLKIKLTHSAESVFLEKGCWVVLKGLGRGSRRLSPAASLDKELNIEQGCGTYMTLR